MTVYVDDMRAPYGRLVLCHMIADTDRELRAMAKAIGLPQGWHQGDHFDVCLTKRTRAIRLGARAVARRVLTAMAQNRRYGFPMGTPETCFEIAARRRKGEDK